jgi:NAD(P)-dependent dehydrogenase (short-subunit alcohol dehydrogenase family)
VTKQTVIITGALTGIGRAAAEAFAKLGHNVVVAGRHQEPGEALADELRADGAEAEFVKTDVRYEEEVARLVDKTLARFGGLDVAINNAGIEGAMGPVAELDKANVLSVFETNVYGVLVSMKHEIRAMSAKSKGSIVNIGSVYGHKGFANGSVYVGSKYAIEGITKSAALEVARAGIRVNAIAPGTIETAMFRRVAGDAAESWPATFPIPRAGRPDEVAKLIAFIASDDANYMTGEVLTIDGGLSL